MSDVSTTNRRATREPASTERFAYQPALDGLRAFAIVAVLLFHYPFHGKAILAGGFLGVDVFFVLSGFLITVLLLQERARTTRISLGAFYVRRARRLLPLLAVVLAFAVVVHIAASPENNERPTFHGIFAAAFYYANWFRTYNLHDLGFLSGTWSLAIEEQFYLVWPLVLIALFALRSSARRMLAVTVVGAAASAVWRLVLINRALQPRASTFVDFYFRMTGLPPPSTSGPPAVERPYYRTDTRADLLLIGCAAAIALFTWAPRLSDRSRGWLGIAGFVGALGTVGVFTQPWPYNEYWIDKWGRVVLGLAVALLITGIVVAPRAMYSRVLAFPVFVWIGRRAYSLYLVHLAVYAFLSQRSIDLGDWGSLAFQLSATFAIASLTYRFVEMPMLSPSTRRRSPNASA